LAITTSLVRTAPPSASSSKLLRYYIHEALEEHCQRGDLVEVILWYRILEKEE
jgi:hypothetical protein